MPSRALKYWPDRFLYAHYTANDIDRDNLGELAHEIRLALIGECIELPYDHLANGALQLGDFARHEVLAHDSPHFPVLWGIRV